MTAAVVLTTRRPTSRLSSAIIRVCSCAAASRALSTICSAAACARCVSCSRTRPAMPRASSMTRVIEEARGIAGRVREQETQRAQAAAEQIVLKARDAAAQEHTRMMAELRREVGRLVVRTTAAVIGKILTPEDQRRLAEETTRELTASE